MFTQQDLSNEVDRVICQIGDDDVVDPAIMTIKILRSHDGSFDIENDIFTFSAYHHVRNIVGKKITKTIKDRNRQKKVMQVDMWPLLFSHYAVERDGRTLHVPRKHMTYRERRQKSQDLQAEGWAKIQHAQQLDDETDALVESGELVNEAVA